MEKLYTFRRTLSAMLLLMTSALTWAYDFEVNGIYYKISGDSKSAAVTRGTSYNSYSGDIVIPSSISYKDETYSVDSIGGEAFMGCHSLTSVKIPSSVIRIGNNAFTSCTSLISIDIPNSVNNIGLSAFSACTSLTSISIPESMTSIGSSAFYECSSLSYISIPKGVTRIEDGTFSNCSSLSSISIPESVTRIGYYAFEGCSALISVICYAEKVPETDSNAFFSTTSEATLYVPASALADYKVAYQWRNFGTILPLEDIPAGISNVEADETNAPCYTLDGIRVENPTKKGIYIRNGKKILIK